MKKPFYCNFIDYLPARIQSFCITNPQKFHYNKCVVLILWNFQVQHNLYSNFCEPPKLCHILITMLKGYLHVVITDHPKYLRTEYSHVVKIVCSTHLKIINK
jgi:hypothetical protein